MDDTQDIIQLLQYGEAGTNATVIDQDLRKLATAVTQTSKRGTLTITIAMEPGKGERAILTKATHKSSIPQNPDGVTLFRHRDGSLHQSREEQRKMDLDSAKPKAKSKAADIDEGDAI